MSKFEVYTHPSENDTLLVEGSPRRQKELTGRGFTYEGYLDAEDLDSARKKYDKLSDREYKMPRFGDCPKCGESIENSISDRFEGVMSCPECHTQSKPINTEASSSNSARSKRDIKIQATLVGICFILGMMLDLHVLQPAQLNSLVIAGAVGVGLSFSLIPGIATLLYYIKPSDAKRFISIGISSLIILSTLLRLLS